MYNDESSIGNLSDTIQNFKMEKTNNWFLNTNPDENSVESRIGIFRKKNPKLH